jgi:hypothetical protein
MTVHFGAWTLGLERGEPPPRDLIGGKAWSVARMLSLGLNTPPAFVVTTDACAAYLSGGDLPQGLEAEILAGVTWLESATQRNFGGGPRPLLVSVRSGAPISMPGMMDTVLNLGINDATESALCAECGDPAFARDVHRRFLDLYGRIVLKSGDFELHPSEGPRAGATVSPPRPARLFPTTSSSSCGPPSARFSSLGTRVARGVTGSTMASPTALALRSPFRRWCSAISTIVPGPASCSRAIR